jgi:transcription elongation GreA/GreB family factor
MEFDDGEKSEVLLVLPEFVDEGGETVSISSPIARALLGRVAGVRVRIELPEGGREARIVSFMTLHALADQASGLA